MDNNADDPKYLAIGVEVGDSKNAATADSSLLGFVANTLSSSAAWSRRLHCQQKSDKTSKNCYNYATKNDKNEEQKTAMCKIAEIARYNKLKHEYILMDENGPAHMKYFTVKLYLCSNEEYFGEGASIKKAQEAAAAVALEHTTLKTPPARGRNKSDMEPVKLLNQVAYQLNLSVDYDCEMISVPIKIPSLRSKSTNKNVTPYNSIPLVKPLFAHAPFPNGIPSQFPINSIPPPFCSTVQLPPSPLNVFALNTGILVPPPVLAPQRQPFEVIQSILYRQIFNCNNPENTQNHHYLPIPQFSIQSCDLHSHDSNNYFNPRRQPAASFKRETINSVDRFITLSNPLVQINSQPKEEWGKKTTLDAIRPPPSIPPLVFMPPFLPPLSNLAALDSAMTPTLPSPQFQLNNVDGAKNGVDANSNHPKSVTSSNGVTGKKSLRVFRITLTLGDGARHVSVAADKLTAKSNAATQALKYLRPLLESLQEEIRKKGSAEAEQKSPALKIKNEKNLQLLSQELNEKLMIETQTSDSVGMVTVEKENDAVDTAPPEVSAKPNARKKKKSIISMIHELAIQLRMDVEFEDVSVVGEAHNRQFTVCCRFVSPRTAEVIEADGHGTSKKWAKQNACQLVYEKIKGLEKDPVYVANSVVKQARKPVCPYQTKAVKRKILVKQRRSDPQYGQWVNPVSRLMQVMQSNDKPDPVFKLLGESGHCKFKEFIVQVSCMDKVVEGRSQNKRLAKRAAADEMLRLLGYAKEMPQPGKSLLKKSAKPMDIGSFDAADLSPSPEENFDEKFYNVTESVDILPFYKTSFTDVCGTFADVDEILKMDEPATVGWNGISAASDDGNLSAIGLVAVERPTAAKSASEETSPPAIRAESSSPIAVRKEEGGKEASMRKRRVTFNNQVSACPPPDDASYPEASIAPLKSEVLFVGNRMRKRGRDSKKVLTVEEKQVLASVTDIFLRHKNNKAITSIPDSIENNWNGSPTANIGFNALQSAKSFLDVIAKAHKFSVIYSDFPKTEQCFSLVTLGVDKPIVCPGSGNMEEEAHEDAALNAIKELSNYAQLSNSTH